MNEMSVNDLKSFLKNNDFVKMTWEDDILVCYDSKGEPFESAEFKKESKTKLDWLAIEQSLIDDNVGYFSITISN